MTKYYFIKLLFVFIASNLFSQNGITQLTNPEKGASFFLINNNDIWIGRGGWFGSDQRHNLGLVKYKNGIKYDLEKNRRFTDGLIDNNNTFICSDLGLFQYDTGIVPSIHYGFKRLSCVAKYKDSLIVGSECYGYAMFKNGFFRTAHIQIGNTVYDTIYAIKPHGNVIYFGTNKGLVKYENSVYSLIPTPIYDTKDSYKNKLQKSILSIQIDVYGKLWYCVKNDFPISNVYVMEDTNCYRIDSLFNSRFCLNANFWPNQISKIQLNAEGHVVLNCGWGVMEFGNQIISFPFYKGLKDYSIWDYEYSNYNYFAYSEKFNSIYFLDRNGTFEIKKNQYSLDHFINSIRYPYISTLESMDVNDINAVVSSDGFLYGGNDFLLYKDNLPGFRLKSGPCANIGYSSGIWMGGISKTNNAIYACAHIGKGSQIDFVPGPINIQTLKFDSILSSNYNRIWSIDKKTIDEFIANHNNSGYQIHQSILDWPGNAPSNCHSKMAPYVDVDNNNVYDPTKGDYPKIKGDKMLWWMFNDVIQHKGSNSKSMMIQINASCYAYNQIDLKPIDSNYIVNRTLLFDYDVINLSNQDYKDVYFSMYNDADIGNYSDDYLGYDTLNNVAFTFNSDNFDEQKGIYNNFGKNPPVLLTQFLNKKMNKFLRIFDITYGINDRGIYYTMLINSDSVYIENYKFNYRFQKYPCQNNANELYPSDIKYIMTNSVGDFNKGDVYNIVFSNSVLYDPNTNFLTEDCNKIKNNILKIQNWYDNDNFPSKSYWPSEIESNEAESFKLYPNPSQNQLNVVFQSEKMRNIQIVSMDGKLLSSYTTDKTLLKLDISVLVPGMYIIQIQDDNALNSKLFVKN